MYGLCSAALVLLCQYGRVGTVTIQHYGSDAGAEMAAVYLSVVSTVKLAGQSVWRFLGDFFEDMVTGGKKHLKLLGL